MPDPNKQHIFLVEDDEKLSFLIKNHLEFHSFKVSVERDGAKAVARIVKAKPDLVILDIMLPGKDGKDICRNLRPSYHGPIVMLTALDEEIDQIIGLELGADDYITKPVRPRFLLSRLNAILRFAARSAKSDAVRDTVAETGALSGTHAIGKVAIHLPSRSAFLNDVPIDLSTTQFDLLAYLVVNAGKVISRDQLFQDLRGIDYDGLNRSIDINIARLREKIGDDAKHPRIIKSIRGEGYLLVKPS